MPTVVRPGHCRQGRPTRAPLEHRRRPKDAGNQLGRQPPPHARLRRCRGVLPEGARVGLLQWDPGRVAHVLPVHPVVGRRLRPLVDRLRGQPDPPASILSLSLALRSRGSSADLGEGRGPVRALPLPGHAPRPSPHPPPGSRRAPGLYELRCFFKIREPTILGGRLSYIILLLGTILIILSS